jgi:predicted ATPase
MSKISIVLTTAALSVATLAAQEAATSRATSAQARASDPDMQRAIQFQRSKDRADERQARVEKRHPSVSYDNADRKVEDPGTVKDPGEKQIKKDKND